MKQSLADLMQAQADMKQAQADMKQSLADMKLTLTSIDKRLSHVEVTAAGCRRAGKFLFMFVASILWGATMWRCLAHFHAQGASLILGVDQSTFTGAACVVWGVVMFIFNGFYDNCFSQRSRGNTGANAADEQGREVAAVSL